MTALPKLALGALLLSVGGAGLAGCGFTPLYASGTLTDSLTGIEVEAPSHSRTAYLMRQAVDDELGRDRSAAPRYRLAVDMSEGRAPRGVRVNNVASRYEITLTTVYYLKDAQTGTVLTTGSFVTQTSYDSVDAPYAGLAASQEGEERATQQAAVRLRLELSRFINGHPYHQEATAAGLKERYTPKAGAQTLSSDPDSEGMPRTESGSDATQPEVQTPNTPGPAQPPPQPSRDPIG